MLCGMMVLDTIKCCYRKIVKPLQYFCHSLPLSYLIEEKQLTFLNKLLYSDNFILRTLASRYSVQFEILALASKYILNTVQNSKSMVKDAMWTCFQHKFNF